MSAAPALQFQIAIDTAAAKAALEQVQKLANGIGKGVSSDPLANVSRSSKRASDELKDIEKSLGSLDSKMRSLSLAAVGYFAFDGLRSAVSTAGELSGAYQRANSSVKLVSTSLADMRAAQADIYKLAQQTSQPFEKIAELYRSVNQTAVGMGRNDGTAITGTLSRLLSVDRAANPAGADGAQIQLGQLLGSRTQNADELNNIREGAPTLAAAIVRGYQQIGFKQVNNTRDISALSESGLATNETTMRALATQAQFANTVFEAMPKTFTQSLNQVTNAASQWVGRFDEASGISRTLSGVVTGVAQSMDAALGTTDFDSRAKAIGASFQGMVLETAKGVDEAIKQLSPLWDDSAARADSTGQTIGNRLKSLGRDAEAGLRTASELIGTVSSGMSSMLSVIDRLPDGAVEYGALGYLLFGKKGAVAIGLLAAAGITPAVISSAVGLTPANDASVSTAAPAPVPDSTGPTWQQGALAGGAVGFTVGGPVGGALGVLGGAYGGAIAQGVSSLRERTERDRLLAQFSAMPFERKLGTTDISGLLSTFGVNIQPTVGQSSTNRRNVSADSALQQALATAEQAISGGVGITPAAPAAGAGGSIASNIRVELDIGNRNAVRDVDTDVSRGILLPERGSLNAESTDQGVARQLLLAQQQLTRNQSLLSGQFAPFLDMYRKSTGSTPELDAAREAQLRADAEAHAAALPVTAGPTQRAQAQASFIAQQKQAEDLAGAQQFFERSRTAPALAIEAGRQINLERSDLERLTGAYQHGSDAVETMQIKLDAERKTRELARYLPAEQAAALLKEAEANGTLQQQMQRVADQADKNKSMFESIGESASSSFFDIITGAKSATDGLADMGKAISKIGFDAFVTSPLKSVLGGISGSVMSSIGLGATDTAGGTQAISTAISSWFGGGRATGGQVSAGYGYLVGENGPEMLFPGVHGAMLNASSTRSMLSGGGGSSPQINVTIQTADKQSFIDSTGQVSSRIYNAVKTGMRNS